MSFPEESQVASVQPKKKSERKRSSQLSERHAPQEKMPTKKNVIPLSRHANSMLAPMSEMADATSRSSSALDDYPMSEFSGEESHSNSSRRSSGRVIFRSVLGLTLVALWAAIASGHLHSELPLLSQMRTQLGLVEHASSDMSSADANLSTPPAVPEPASAQTASMSSETAPMSPEATINPSAESQSAAASVTETAAQSQESSAVKSTSMANVVETKLPETPASLSSSTTMQQMRVPAIPGSVSSADVEKTAKLFLTQGAQLNALEVHLAQLLLQHASTENLDSILDQMERRHQDALKSLQALRNKVKKSQP
jgi:hypothetical protein